MVCTHNSTRIENLKVQTLLPERDIRNSNGVTVFVGKLWHVWLVGVNLPAKKPSKWVFSLFISLRNIISKETVIKIYLGLFQSKMLRITTVEKSRKIYLFSIYKAPTYVGKISPLFVLQPCLRVSATVLKVSHYCSILPNNCNYLWSKPDLSWHIQVPFILSWAYT